MYGGLISRTYDEIGAVKRHLRTSETLRKALLNGEISCTINPQCFDVAAFSNAPDNVQWRVIDYCSAVSRIYAIYEQFIHKIVREYVSFIESNLSISELGASFLSSYNSGISNIMSKIDRVRYSSISLPSLIRDYSGALSGEEGYKLEAEAFLTHERNLRLSDLNDIFSACSVSGMTSWIEAHPRMIRFFQTEQRLTSTVTSELKQFVQSRNDAAHGALTVDDIEGVETLIEYADFIALLCDVVAERAQKEVIDRSEEKGRASANGDVTELYMDKKVLVGILTGTFEVGGKIYMCGDNYCKETEILSIQLNNEDVDGVSLLSPVELGIKISARGKLGARLKSAFPAVRSGDTLPNFTSESATPTETLGDDEAGNLLAQA